MTVVDDGIEEILTYCDFPSGHWTHIRTNNGSAMWTGTQWGNKKYMNMKHLEAILADTSVAG